MGTPQAAPQRFAELYEPMLDACLLCMQDNVTKTGELIVKSANDTRDYKHITLPNGMRAVLVSDLKHHHTCRIEENNTKPVKLTGAVSNTKSRSRTQTNRSSTKQVEEQLLSETASTSSSVTDEEMEADENLWESDNEASSLPSTRSNASVISQVAKKKGKKKHKPPDPITTIVEEVENEDNIEEQEITKKKEDKSKSETEKLSAAALCVNVGSFSDPEDIPGLAHFLEHMLFMGSEKYPDENYFDAYLKNFGGASNAYTDVERTVFFFDVPRKQFKNSLDIFAQFFISPLMKKESVNREINAVDSEFDISKINDCNRKEQLLGLLAKPKHPMGKFFWGNLASLKTIPEKKGINVYNRLREFYVSNYNARNMTLAVQSREPIEHLEKTVRKIFGIVPNHVSRRNSFSVTNLADPFDTKEFTMLYKIVPVSNRHQLDLVWALPPLTEYYREKPLTYIASWMGHEGEGSLLSYLRKNHLAVGLTCGNTGSGFDTNSSWTAYVTTLSLTDAGLANLYQVLMAVFEYMAMMRQHCPTRVFYDELHAIECNNFRFLEQGDAVDNVSSISVNMNLYPPMDLLTGDMLFLRYDENLLRRCLNAMHPRKCNLSVMSKHFEGQCSLKEPWFGTMFSKEPIPEKWLQAFEHVQARPNIFHPPVFNTYIATDFMMLPTPKPASTVPMLIRETMYSKVWYKQDHKFCTPKAHCYFLFKSSFINQSPRAGALMDLYIAALKQNLTEVTYPAIIAGLDFSIRSSEQALIIKCHGFSHKITELVLTIINALVGFDIEEGLYEPLVAQLKQDYYNQYIKPESLAKEARVGLLLDRSWSSLDCQHALKLVTRPALLAFAKDFTRHLFMESLIMGNLTSIQALALDDYIVGRLQYSPLPPSLQPTNRVVQLPKAECVCRIQNLNSSDNNSVIINYYQHGPYDTREHAVSELLMSRMEEPCFDILRTREQLGYSVSNSLRNTMGILGFNITVCSQANKFSMDELDRKIEEFLEEFSRIVEGMSEEEFRMLKDSHIALRSCDDTYLEEEVNRFWAEVVSGTYNFDRLEKAVRALETVMLRDLKNWNKHHKRGGPRFRKLSIQVAGNQNVENAMDTDQRPDIMSNPHYAFLPLKAKSKQEAITDFHLFKNSRKLYPVTKAVDDAFEGGSAL